VEAVVKMPFGKYKGGDLEDIPDDYLLWVLDNCELRSPTLRRAIHERLGLTWEPDEGDEEPSVGWGRAAPPPPQPPGGAPVAAIRAAVLDAVKQWHRRAALAHHPDRGGSVATMQAINAAADDLAAEITRRLALYG
jgi:hypothetical protein